MSISSVTSEALQLKLRQLLPSQQGFGTDLSASDTIIPVIDLTAAAEGSDVPEYLQRALAHGSQTSFRVTNTTSTLINTTGFYRVFGCATNKSSSSTDEVKFSLTDGATPKIIWSMEWNGGTGLTFFAAVPFDFTVFLAAGDSLTATSDTVNGIINGSTRQVADINGTLVQPVGFTPS